MIQLFTVSVTSKNGKEAIVPVDMIACVLPGMSNGSTIRTRDGQQIESTDSPTTIKTAIDALQSSFLTALTGV